MKATGYFDKTIRKDKMKIMKIQHGSLYLFETDKVYLQVWNEWGQLFTPKAFNWINFNFAIFEVDWERYMGEFTIVVGLLGIVARFNWHYTDSKAYLELMDTLDDTVKKIDKKLKKGKK